MLIGRLMQRLIFKEIYEMKMRHWDEKETFKTAICSNVEHLTDNMKNGLNPLKYKDLSHIQTVKHRGFEPRTT